ncbi:MAG: HNH endonuclease [Planctomycetes bacterium]|nr:HNH endonuclease [Planctomycetota bacterium]
MRHYRDGHGTKPSDSKWRDFHENVSNAFSSLCGYCEEICKGEVDHFRPKSKFPERVYEWDNWVLACHTCNRKKNQHWPSGGYVDPCAKSQRARPESYFHFDTKTGEILPKSELAPGRWRKADRMIADIGLNAYHHLKQRAQWLRLVSEALNAVNDADNEELIEFVASRGTELSSIARAWIQQQGYSYGD